MSKIKFEELEIGDRVIGMIHLKDGDGEGNPLDLFYTGEIESVTSKGQKVTWLLDEKLEDGSEQIRKLNVDNIIGWASDVVNPNEMAGPKAYKKYLLDEKPAAAQTPRKSTKVNKEEAEDENPPEVVEDTPRKSKPGSGKPKPTENTGPSLKDVPKYDPKKAKLGDRVLVDHWYDTANNNKIKAGYYKGKITEKIDSNSLLGIFYDSGGDDADGWIRADWIVGKATEKLHKRAIGEDRILQHLVGEDGKPIEAMAESIFNNNNPARFDALEVQIAELKEMLTTMTKLLTKKMA